MRANISQNAQLTSAANEAPIGCKSALAVIAVVEFHTNASIEAWVFGTPGLATRPYAVGCLSLFHNAPDVLYHSVDQ